MSLWSTMGVSSKTRGLLNRKPDCEYSQVPNKRGGRGGQNRRAVGPSMYKIYKVTVNLMFFI